jgi:hypothetical protein
MVFPRRFYYDVYIEGLPVEVGDIFFVEEQIRFAIDDDACVIARTIIRQHAVNAVVFNKVRHRAIVGDVVDGDDFDLRMVDEQAEKVPADASESVDGDSSHNFK